MCVPPTDDVSRRRLLGALGTTVATAGSIALAGCNSVPGTGGDSRGEFHSSELPDVPEDPQPAIWATYPFSLPESHFQSAHARANDALEGAPLPLGPDRIPNGHVRKHLTESAERARDALDDAFTAPTPRASLRHLRRARSSARYVEAGWSVVEGDLTADAIRDSSREVLERALAERDHHDYVGTDPVDATVVHAGVESLLRIATDAGGDTSHDERVRVLYVAELAENVERSRASLDDAIVVRETNRREQPDDAWSLEARIDEASERLATQIQDRIDDLPSERDALTLPDDDLDDTAARRVLGDLYREGATYDTPSKNLVGPARNVVLAVSTLAANDAYRTVRDRIESGERYAVTGARDVEAAFGRAHAVLVNAPARSSAPGLARAALTEQASRISFTDARLAERDGMVDARSMRRFVVQYVVAAAIADAVPGAVDVAVDALED